MSLADNIFIGNVKHILEDGVWDTDQKVRPHWEDGTPAHTISVFGVVNRYDLQKEFPMLTLRRTYWKSALDELLWIWQKKSNNVNDLKSHVWDAWAGADGSIGKAYGYQLGVVLPFPEGPCDQVDHILWQLTHDPASRRIMANMYNHHDLHEMALAPCAYSVTFSVKGDKLNMILNQRSQDMLTANGWNVTQYAFLLAIMAKVTGYQPGELVHVIADCHIYDRHVKLIEELIKKELHPAPTVSLAPVTSFYGFTPDDVSVTNYHYSDFSHSIPVAI